MGDSMHTLSHAEKPPFLFLIYGEAAHCGCSLQEGLHTSLKTEEALIYIYDGRIVGMSELGSVQAH